MKKRMKPKRPVCTTREELRAAIIEEVKASGKSLNQLGKDSGIGHSILSEMMSGKKGGSYETLFKLANHFKIPYKFSNL